MMEVQEIMFVKIVATYTLRDLPPGRKRMISHTSAHHVAPKFRFKKVPKGSESGKVEVKKSWFG